MEKFNQKKQKSVSPNEFCKDIVNWESIAEPSQMDIVDQVMGIHFQEEIIIEILIRLPVWSLLRFKCVSKLWKTLISDPYFKTKHLNHAKNDQNAQKFLSCQFCYEDDRYNLYCCSLSSDQPVEDARIVDVPSNPNTWEALIQCCCDGLVVIDIAINDYDRLTLLWNPSTRESVILPYPEFGLDRSSCLGLGYDSTTGDYKILHVRNEKEDNPKLPLEILALKSGSWRKIDKHPRGIRNVVSGMHSLAFLHDAFHWVGISRDYSLVSFNISNEEYGEIPLPKQIQGLMSNSHIGVSVLDGMLCVHSANIQRKETFKLWVLKNYGVNGSWNALFTIEDPPIYRAVPKYRFASGEVLFWCKSRQYHSAFRTSKGSFGSWQVYDNRQDGFVFTESLISPKLCA